MSLTQLEPLDKSSSGKTQNAHGWIDSAASSCNSASRLDDGAADGLSRGHGGLDDGAADGLGRGHGGLEDWAPDGLGRGHGGLEDWAPDGFGRGPSGLDNWAADGFCRSLCQGTSQEEGNDNRY